MTERLSVLRELLDLRALEADLEDAAISIRTSPKRRDIGNSRPQIRVLGENLPRLSHQAELAELPILQLDDTQINGPTSDISLPLR